MYYCVLSLGVLEHTPQISCHFPKKLNYLQKKINPPPPEKSRTPRQETQGTALEHIEL